MRRPASAVYLGSAPAHSMKGGFACSRRRAAGGLVRSGAAHGDGTRDLAAGAAEDSRCNSFAFPLDDRPRGWCAGRVVFDPRPVRFSFGIGPVRETVTVREIGPMKIRNSLKSLRGRHRDNQVVRRKGRVYVINKTQKRFKARQG